MWWLSAHMQAVIEVDVVLRSPRLRRWLPAPSCCWCPGAATPSTRCRTTAARRRPGPAARRAPAVDGRRGKIPVGQTQCSDGIDNDGDGKIDYDDPECVGPLDNDESSFATGIPGDNVDACKQDCFFDGNSGMGDDGCQWQLKCDPMSTNARVPVRSGLRRPARDRVLGVGVAVADVHRQLPEAGAERLRLLRLLRGPGRVDADPAGRRPAPPTDFGDPTKCPPCTQVTQCMTPCGHCELLHRQGDAARRLHAPTAARPTPARPATSRAGSTASIRRCARTDTGCVTGCCRPLVP